MLEYVILICERTLSFLFYYPVWKKSSFFYGFIAAAIKYSESSLIFLK